MSTPGQRHCFARAGPANLLCAHRVVEGHLDDLGRGPCLAQVDLELGPLGAEFGGHVSHRDHFVQGRAQAAAGDMAEKKMEAARVIGTSPSHPLANYEGTYTNELYGELVVTLKDNALLINLNNTAKATLAHWNYDTFRGYYEKRWWGQTSATFATSPYGKIQSVMIEGMEFTRSNK